MKVFRVTLAAALIVGALAVLELARGGVTITQSTIGTTPVTRYARADATGPTVVIAHGFAGSQHMMQGYALPLARAGYRVHAFDFLGHGRNSEPMSGDVTRVDGTTRLLVEQTREVLNAVAEPDRQTAVLGHSMATDVLVRAAAGRGDIGPMVLISAFSQEITGTFPKQLLVISGAWEARLRAFGLEAVRMVDAQAVEGETVQNGPVVRRALAAPLSEHVSILQSRAARHAALGWLDQSYGRTSAVHILQTGWAILGLLAGLVLSFRPIVSALLTAAEARAQVFAPSSGQFAVVLIMPMLIAPLLAVPLNPSILPVLVADYLGLHMLIFGGAQLLMLKLWGAGAGRISWRGFGLLLAWSALFGLALDRYAASFVPTPERLLIIAALLLGTVPFMLADSLLTARSSPLRRVFVRAAFLISLGIAVALDFEGLFFLMLIAPILILFYLVFGTMGRQVAKRAGPLAAGLALGLVLAWSLGVSFPMFQA